jgi:hypothetical protein
MVELRSPSPRLLRLIPTNRASIPALSRPDPVGSEEEYADAMARVSILQFLAVGFAWSQQPSEFEVTSVKPAAAGRGRGGLIGGPGIDLSSGVGSSGELLIVVS